MTPPNVESRRYGLAVIGGGIVGTAAARALLERFPGLDLVLLEKEAGLARHQTGHNSGVIHSGLYYRPGSLKARNCTEGREALYAFCAERGVPHERCGKVVVAVDEGELPALEELERRGRENGLEGLERLDGRQLREYEPRVRGVAGLHVPQTGIVDFVAVTEALAAEVGDRGGEIRLGARVEGVAHEGEGFRLDTSSGAVRAERIVNCAGLHSDRVARLCGSDPDLRIVPFRGEYYDFLPDSRDLVKNLVYPVPDPELPFLGVHLTRMIDGGAEAGPNAVLALAREGYGRFSFGLRDSWETFTFPGFWRLAGRFWRTGLHEVVRSFSKQTFVRDLQRLVPAISGADLVRGSAGVRAQAVGRDGRLLDDFRLEEGEGMIHVLNAPSPAATASLSIGRAIAERAGELFGLGGEGQPPSTKEEKS